MIKPVALSLAVLLSLCAAACADRGPEYPGTEDVADEEEAAATETFSVDLAEAPPAVRAEIDRFERCLREHGVDVPGPGGDRIFVHHHHLRGEGAEEGAPPQRGVRIVLRRDDPALAGPGATPADPAAGAAPTEEVSRAVLEACPPPRLPAPEAVGERAPEPR
jgi:hypothetical protein